MPDKLLQVLDMTEEEQCRFLSNYFIDEYFKTDKWPQWYGVCDILVHNTFPSRKVILADLAFRLRDETKEDFDQALIDIYEAQYQYSTYQDVFHWMCSKKCKPIHWIIASLMAKGLAKEKRRPL